MNLEKSIPGRGTASAKASRKELSVLENMKGNWRVWDIVSEKELERPDHVGLRLGIWVYFSVMGSCWNFLGLAHDML